MKKAYSEMEVLIQHLLTKYHIDVASSSKLKANQQGIKFKILQKIRMWRRGHT
jgi:hypothetical protein